MQNPTFIDDIFPMKDLHFDWGCSIARLIAKG